MKTVRIVFISPYPPLKDGLATYTKQFIDELQAKGATVDVITNKHIGFSPRKLVRAYRFLRDKHPDVVHTQYTIPAFGLAAFPLWALLFVAKRRLHFRTVITFHEVQRETSLFGFAGAVYIHCVAKLADAITVHTHEAVRLLSKRCGVPAGKSTYLPHPLYIYALNQQNVPMLRQRHKLSGKPVVLFFGFIHVDKGIDHLITAFAQARKADKRLDDAVLVIAGSVRKREGLFKLFERKDLDYKAQLHHLVQMLKLRKNVLFTPYVPDEEVGSWFHLADVVALPYTNLEQSGVLNLALGSKTPMIVSNLGGLGETMAGTTALVPPADDGALAAKLQSLLTDSRQTKTLVAHYDRIREERTIQTVSTSLLKLYSRIGKETA